MELDHSMVYLIKRNASLKIFRSTNLTPKVDLKIIREELCFCIASHVTSALIVMLKTNDAKTQRFLESFQVD